MGLPINVLICIILSIIVCPRVIVLEGARAPGVGVTGWDWATMVVLAEAVGFGAGVTPMSPTIAVAAIVVLGAG